jgi:hypothetical protein
MATEGKSVEMISPRFSAIISRVVATFNYRGVS